MKYLVEVTKETREEDVHVIFDNETDATIFVAQFGPTDHGYRIFPYESGVVADLRPDSKAVVRVLGETEDTETIYDTLQDSQDAIDSLNASDGYFRFDLEQPVGSAPSLPMDSRPRLWIRGTEVNGDGVSASRQNGWERQDNDRF